jgi:hypothetical protein
MVVATTRAPFDAFARAWGAVVSVIRRRTREPALPRMSDAWLRSLDYSSGGTLDNWHDSW